ncbi:MAG: TIGR00725 family protein [bacterium]
MKPRIAVVGDSDPSPETAQLAEAVGQRIASSGAVLVCGGLGGVMEAAGRGAKAAGGLTVGILPGYDPAAANPYIDLPICSGMGHARNAIIAATADALIALEGSYGTLSEMALGLKLGRRVVSLGRRENPPGVLDASDPDEAVRMALGE